MVNYNKGQ